MAFSQVQGAAGSASATTSMTITLTSNPTLGDLVCVAVTPAVAVTAMTCKDSNNNSYTATPSSPSTIETGAGQVWLFYLLSAPSNATKTLTVAWTTSSDAGGWADEFSYGTQTCTFDKDASGVGTTGTTINLPSITPTNSGSLLYAAAAAGGTISAPTANATLGSWTGSGGAITDGDMAEYDLNASGATAVQFTQTSGNWSALAMAFFLTTPSSGHGSWMFSGIGV